jgi:hypothetical protein
MNKKVIIGIVLFLILTTLVVGFWFIKNKNKAAINKQQNQNNKIKIDEDTRFGTRLTEEEIENIKDGNYFVWYEIPELGIRFKVSEYAESDLKYEIVDEKDIVSGKEYEIKRAYIYRQSVVDFLDHEWCFNNNDENLCTDGVLSLYDFELNELYKKSNSTNDMLNVCRDTNIISNIGNSIICFTGPQASNFKSEYEYNEYLEYINNREFKMYLKTTEKIKK